MSDSCCASEKTPNDPRWRRALWIALGIYLAMFATEMIAGSAADSRALQADALDFLGDAVNYAISLLVAALLASLGIGGGWQIVLQALRELRGVPSPRIPTQDRSRA